MLKMTAFDDSITTGSDRYLLLNRDREIALFELFHYKDLEDLRIIEVYTEPPFWISDLKSFIIHRKAPKQRANIIELLQRSGCDTLCGWLNFTHALSLVDTYWVKPEGSTLVWSQVSLYTHDFNEVIARTAFEGGLHGDDLSTTSPEYSTNGTFAKCWIRENNVIKLLKRGSTGARNAGLEPYSEFYASQIANALHLDHVDYDLRIYHNRLCSVCDAFTSEEIGYLPFGAIDSKSSTPLDIIQQMAKYNLSQEAMDMFVFDAVIFNEDRHKGNFGFIVRNHTQEICGMAPLFDHNISLLCYAEKEEFDSIDSYLMEKKPCIGDDFIKTARAFLSPDMKKRLQNLYGFQFCRHAEWNLPEWRLEALEKLINRQISLILQK